MMTKPITVPVISEDVTRWVADTKLVSITIRNARQLDEKQLQEQAFSAYQQLYRQIRKTSNRHIIRMWNFIPDLLMRTSNGHDRYMAFNAGRYSGMCEWFGGPDRLEHFAPAATGVGTASDDLSIYALTAQHAARAYQNPRQIPSMNYSSRYGPQPPCFARATGIDGVIWVSGTAAINGEDSVAGDVKRQFDVTIKNLQHLLTHTGLQTGISAFRQLRVYYPHPGDLEELQRSCQQRFMGVKQIEYVQVDLCRRELRVEIEGIATESVT